MFTRKQFIDGKCNYSEYYDQLIDSRSESIIAARLSREIKDGTISEVPLESWDALSNFHGSTFAQNFIDLKDVCTQSGMVCLFKHQARKLMGQR